MSQLFRFLFNFALNIIKVLLGGYVLSRMWEWFIIPKFSFAPQLHYLDCVGLMIVVNFFFIGQNMSIAMLKSDLKTLKKAEGRKGKDETGEIDDSTKASFLTLQ